jgi:pyridoxine 5-phosphate synthase
MTLLGVNVDHVATLRNVRGGTEPEPIQAALLAEMAGADSIVCHVREDRRHIRDRDLRLLRQVVKTSLQLEMALEEDLIGLALEVRPNEVMIVPERRQELTTEGGFDAVGRQQDLAAAVKRFREVGVGVSVFVDALLPQVEAAHRAGAGTIELHTGPFSHTSSENDVENELDKLETAAHRGWELGLQVHAGHGLDYRNVELLIRKLPVEKVNIGHAIISRAVFSGIENAVRDMKALITAAS